MAKYIASYMEVPPSRVQSSQRPLELIEVSREASACSVTCQLKRRARPDPRDCLRRKSALRKRLTESTSYFSSLPVDPLVSIRMATESGCSVWCSKTEICCSTPLSKIRKFGFVERAD